MDAQVQSGLMVKEDALVNPEDAFFQGPGKVLYFKQTANLATDVAPIPPPPVAQGWMELIQTIEKEIMDIVGPEELFAQNMGEKDMTAVLMKLKMGMGLTGLRNIFDRLNQSQMYIGEIMDDMIINNFSPGKVKQILGKDPSQLFFENRFSKFNCVVEEAELTSSQRQLKLLQAVQLKQIIPDSISDAYILEVSSLQDKKKLVENAKQAAEQASQMQQMQAMQQLQQGEVLNRSIEAKAQSDFASAKEKLAKSVADISMAQEHASKAVHDRASAALENAKSLKELDTMGEDRLLKLSQFVIDLQRHQKEMENMDSQMAMSESQMLAQKVEMAEAESKPTAGKQAAQQ
jgi:predicted DNA-binding ribbon-helix-helix protein